MGGNPVLEWLIVYVCEQAYPLLTWEGTSDTGRHKKCRAATPNAHSKFACRRLAMVTVLFGGRRVVVLGG